MTEIRKTGSRNKADVARTDHRNFHLLTPATSRVYSCPSVASC
jgi:hypothetical protein